VSAMPKRALVVLVGVGEQGDFVLADDQGSVGKGVLERGVAGDVIDMSVRVEDRVPASDHVSRGLRESRRPFEYPGRRPAPSDRPLRQATYVSWSKGAETIGSIW